MPSTGDETTPSSNGECPDFRVMTIEFHDLLVPVAVPVLDGPVFGGREEVVGVWDETDLHDGVLVGEDGFMAVAEIETPDFDVFVGASSD